MKTSCCLWFVLFVLLLLEEEAESLLVEPNGKHIYKLNERTKRQIEIHGETSSRIMKVNENVRTEAIGVIC